MAGVMAGTGGDLWRLKRTHLSLILLLFFSLLLLVAETILKIERKPEINFSVRNEKTIAIPRYIYLSNNKKIYQTYQRKK